MALLSVAPSLHWEASVRASYREELFLKDCSCLPAQTNKT